VHGFGDIQVNMTGCKPTISTGGSGVIKAQTAAHRWNGLD